MSGNYVATHVHSDLSLLDSCTPFKLYVDRAVELGQKAIASTEHGKPLQWVQKKMYCDEKGIKFLFGVECYLTKELLQLDIKTGERRKVRDNYHTILVARDYQGIQEINQAITISTDEEHTYYVNRMTFEEFLALSPHVITTSACLASPLNKLDISDPWYTKLVQRYDFLEIQPHNVPEQIAFNRHLACLAEQYHKPLIASTDAHSLDQYKAECRDLLMDAKNQHYAGEEEMDLTYKSYDELVGAFRKQDAIPENLWMQAIENTNTLADMVEDFELDTSLKYPKLYGSSEADRKKLVEVTYQSYQEKLNNGIIPRSEKPGFDEAIPEELRVFEKIDMSGYMLCMSELIRWCWKNDIPVGPGRGSVGGSRVAYVTDIIDIDPERWGTIFSRFANEYRKEVGDIDVDVIDTDRPKIFKYLIDRFGQAYTARVPTWGTAAASNTIELICMGLRNRWEIGHGNLDGPKKKKYSPDNPYSIRACEKLKEQYADGLKKKELLKDKKEQEYLKNLDEAKKSCPEVFYYFDGIYGSKVSQGVHAAGIVVSPITLQNNYGCFWKDGELVLDIDMEEIHESGLVKFDLLVLNNIGIIRDACQMAGIPYPKTHQIDFDDQKVWADMMRSPVGIFQFEASHAFKLLRDFGTKSIFDMALISAVNRPACASFQDDLVARKPHKNPSPLIDNLLERNGGYLVFQEDTLRFLQEICGLSGSDADNVRRAIGRKQKDRLDDALPDILAGYCAKSDKPKEVAEEEAKEFLQILEDSASYQFNYSHAVAYSIVGYILAWLRCYYPGELISTYLNRAKNDDDIAGGTELAKLYKIQIAAPRYELSSSDYSYDKDTNTISKGISSLKGYGKAVCDQLHAAGQKHRTYFMDVLRDLDAVSIKAAKVRPLIQIDYFSSFGNITELTKILTLFDFFKQGAAKSVKKDKVSAGRLNEILSNFATDKNANGKVLSSYTITDMDGLLHSLEDEIKAMTLPDVPLKVKMQNQLEILGYIDIVTGKKEDQRKLIIMDIFPLRSKKTKEIWAYALQVRSIGTGKVNRWTIYSDLYDRKPLRRFDTIYVPMNGWGERRGYLYLYNYDYVI